MALRSATAVVVRVVSADLCHRVGISCSYTSKAKVVMDGAAVVAMVAVVLVVVAAMASCRKKLVMKPHTTQVAAGSSKPQCRLQ